MLKRFSAAMLIITLLLSTLTLPTVFAEEEADKWDGTTVASTFAGGSGTQDDPYLISTCAQLALLRDIVNASDGSYDTNYAATFGARETGAVVSGSNLTHKRLSGKYFKLTNDLDMDGKNMKMGIGNSTGNASTFTFAGIFDGNYHIIRNYYTSYAWDLRAMGLFGITENATIKNLGVEFAKVSVANANANFGYAVLIGKAYGTLDLSNCYVRNSKVEITSTLGADSEMGLGILTGSIGDTASTGNKQQIDNCYAVNNEMIYSGEAEPRTFKKASVFGNTKAYEINVNNCYASCLTFTNMNLTGSTARTNGMFTPSISGTTACSSTGENCYVEGEASASPVDYLKLGETFTAVSASELKALPSGLNSQGAYETTYADSINNGYPVLAWESEKFAATAIMYETAKGIIDNFDFAMISSEEASAVTENLNLFTEMDGLTCIWETSRSSSINAYGTVKRDFVDRSVTLTLRVQFPDGTFYSQKKEINVTVQREESNLEALTMKFDKWDGSVAKSFDGGDGTSENPYQIATGAQLALLRNIVNATKGTYESDYQKQYGARPDGGEIHTFPNTHFILTADIDLANINFGAPIGTYIDSANTFYFDGSFDGDGHVIKNFLLTTGVRNSGLFGYINNSEIRNLGMENVNILLGEAVGYGYYGMLVSKARSGNTISDCYVKNGSISISNKLTGTVTTYMAAICAHIGVAGAPASSDRETTIQNCYAINTSFNYTYGNSVVFDGPSIFGAVGDNCAIIKNCYAANATFGEDMIFPTVTTNFGMMFRPNMASNGTTVIENCFVQVPNSETGTYSYSLGKVQKISGEELCKLPAGLNSGEAFTKEYSQETNGGFPILVWEKYAYELIENMIYNTFTFSKISNESAEAVSENLNLITDLGYGVSGKWTSDNPMVIENDGTVHRRSFEQKAVLTLELLFRGDTAFPQKISYDVTVMRLDGYSDDEILKEYLDVVITENYFTDQPLQSITENLKNALPEEGPDGINLSWENSDEVHIASDGTVLRPSWDEDDAEVNIKLTAARGTATAEKLFSFTVLKHTDPETALSKAMNSVTYDDLTAENPSSITKKLNLPMDFSDYVSVEWSSSREDVISIEGKVSRQMHNTAVTITATFTHELSGETASKDFSFNVLLSPEGKMTEDYNKIVFQNIDQTVSDFDLTLIGSEYQSTINWTSSNTDILYIMQYAGVVQVRVKRPSFEEGDKVVTLTAAMENEGQKKSFTFDFVVLKLPSNEDVVQSAYDFITYETISAEPSSEIRNNLSLIKSFETGVVCDWSISDNEAVNEDGKIFPALNEDKEVTLTVNIHKGAVSKTKNFSFVIKGLSEQELLEKAREYLTFDSLTNESIEEVCNDFVLPQTGDFGTVISWKSGNADLLETVNEDGQMIAKVKRPGFEENGKVVSLTATISLGELKETKEFFITVKAQTVFSSAFLLDFENDVLDNLPSDPPTGTWAKSNADISAITVNDPTGADNKVLMLSNAGASDEGLRYTNGDDKSTVKGIVYAEMRLFVPSETQGARIRLYNFSETVMADVTIQQNGQIVVTVFDEGFREIFLKSKENLYDFDKWNDILMICNTETGKIDFFLNGDCISDNGVLTVNGDKYFEDGIPFKSILTTASKYFPLRKVRIDAKKGTVYADDISFKQLMSRYSELLYKSMESIDSKFCEQNRIEALKENLKIPDAPAGFILRTYSSNEDVLSDAGTVYEVIDSDGYAEFTIELEYQAEKVRKTYPVYVSATTYTDEERVAKDMEAIYADIMSKYDFSNIREDMSFTTSAKYGSEVSIVSDNSKAISNNGKVTRTDKDQKATIKLTVRRNDAVIDKTFVVTVKAKESPAEEVSIGGGGSAGSVAFGKNAAQNIFNRPETPVSFKDVKSSHWAYEAIMSLAEDGVVSGGENNYFNPDSNIKREEFIKILLLAFNIEIGDYKNDFKDVDKTAWYRLYVSTARYHKITLGDENGNFGTGSEMTRQDMAVMISRVAGLSESSSVSNTFADDAQIADYAKNAVYSMKAKGILNGKGDNKFAPQDTATRAEAAMLLYRISKER